MVANENIGQAGYEGYSQDLEDSRYDNDHNIDYELKID